MIYLKLSLAGKTVENLADGLHQEPKPVLVFTWGLVLDCYSSISGAKPFNTISV